MGTGRAPELRGHPVQWIGSFRSARGPNSKEKVERDRERYLISTFSLHICMHRLYNTHTHNTYTETHTTAYTHHTHIPHYTHTTLHTPYYNKHTHMLSQRCLLPSLLIRIWVQSPRTHMAVAKPAPVGCPLITTRMPWHIYACYPVNK